MHMRMGVRFAGWVAWRVTVRMIFVMQMRMRVRLRRVNVLMFVTFGHMQPDPQCHQQARNNKLACQRFVEEGYRNRGAKERRNREVSGGSGSPELTQRQHKENQAYAVAHEPDDGCGEGR